MEVQAVQMNQVKVAHIPEVMQPERIQHQHVEQAANAEASSSVEAQAAEAVSKLDMLQQGLQGMNTIQLRAAEAALMKMARDLG